MAQFDFFFGLVFIKIKHFFDLILCDKTFRVYIPFCQNDEDLFGH